ncbi:hypothetical protein [Chryseobacterium sp.]|uniref:hypothetical protein n=1 Tax=Chryseobacterium sp. TaxID=1871047 RepID=UPI0028A2CA9A|nr:hypothetical protein [Chryseobacterium sp.]
MKKTFSIIILFLIIGAVVACKSRQPVIPVTLEKTKEVTKIIRDTVFKVEKDSSYYEAFIDCVNGKPIIRETPETVKISKAGRALEIPKVNIAGNKLSVNCTKQAEELFKQWQEVYIKEHEQTPIYVDKPIPVEKPLSWFQKTQLWLGRIFLSLIAITLLAFILRWKKII